jgi:hypothetical protein
MHQKTLIYPGRDPGETDIQYIFLNRIVCSYRGAEGYYTYCPQLDLLLLHGGRGILDTSSLIGSSAPKRGQRDIRHIVRVVGQHCIFKESFLVIPGRKSFAEKTAKDASVTALRN